MARKKEIPNVSKKPGLPVTKTGLLIPADLREKFETACFEKRLSMTSVTIDLWRQWLQQVDGAIGQEADGAK